MKKAATAFFMAWGMFFAVPCPCRIWEERCRAGMLLCLPLIGALVGGLWALAAWLLERAACPSLLSAAILTLLPALLTGFLHLDGFMDCCDAILSRRDLEGRRRILKDSHCGSFAVICLVSVFLLEFALLASAAVTGRLACLVLIPVVSRLCSVLAICRLRPMPGSSYDGAFQTLLRPWHGRLTLGLLAAACVLPPLLQGVPGLCCPAAAAGSLLAVADGRKQLGGMSGDISGLGIVCGELCGIAALTLL